MCGSITDIQSATAEKRARKTEEEEENTAAKYNVHICCAGWP